MGGSRSEERKKKGRQKRMGEEKERERERDADVSGWISHNILTLSDLHAKKNLEG